VIPGAERVEESSHDLLTFTLPVEIALWTDKRTGPPAETLEDLLADVRKAVQQVNAFGTQALDVDDLGASAPGILESDPDRSVLTLTIEVPYRHQRMDPSLP